ncbi:MAG: hypothetical protein K0S45_1596 [Nitrospira sp.]|nr:hypothetical protein [Nitrospira sp.]
MAGHFIHRILRKLTGNSEPSAFRHELPVNNDFERLSSRPRSDRRIDVRFAVRSPCIYELVEGQGEEACTVRGKAYSLNISVGGILLLLDRKPDKAQLVAIYNPALQQHLDGPRFEVRWSMPLPFGKTPERYLAGCHLTFGRFPYFLVQRHHIDQNISGLPL